MKVSVWVKLSNLKVIRGEEKHERLWLVSSDTRVGPNCMENTWWQGVHISVLGTGFKIWIQAQALSLTNPVSWGK